MRKNAEFTERSQRHARIHTNMILLVSRCHSVPHPPVQPGAPAAISTRLQVHPPACAAALARSHRRLSRHTHTHTVRWGDGRRALEPHHRLALALALAVPPSLRRDPARLPRLGRGPPLCLRLRGVGHRAVRGARRAAPPRCAALRRIGRVRYWREETQSGSRGERRDGGKAGPSYGARAVPASLRASLPEQREQ